MCLQRKSANAPRPPLIEWSGSRELGEETDPRIQELRESGAHTDRRLDALISVVDKLTRRNSGGNLGGQTVPYSPAEGITMRH